MFPPASGGERAISGQGRAAQEPHTNPDHPRACWVTGARLSPPHTRARGSVDALPALGPTHGAPPPAQGENFLLSPQPGPDCRGQWVMILSTSSSPGHLDRRPVSSSCDFSGCSFTRKRFLFYAEGLGIKQGRRGWWPWPPCLGHMLFPQTYLLVAHVLLCFSSCICSHLMKPERPPKAETLPSTSLGSLPELAHLGRGQVPEAGLILRRGVTGRPTRSQELTATDRITLWPAVSSFGSAVGDTAGTLGGRAQGTDWPSSLLEGQ